MADSYARSLEYLHGPRCKDDFSQTPDLPLPPVVGCTAVGHTLRFYVACKEASGGIHAMKPLEGFDVGKTDILRIFKLLKAVMGLDRLDLDPNWTEACSSPFIH